MHKSELSDHTRIIIDTATPLVIRGRSGKMTATNLERKENTHHSEL